MEWVHGMERAHNKEPERSRVAGYAILLGKYKVVCKLDNPSDYT